MARYAPKGMPSVAGVAPHAITPNATSFLYGNAAQFAAADGLFATATIAQPALAAGDFHSLAELAAQSADGRQIVEVGWTVDRGVNGDNLPHLFVFHWVDGVPSCYNGCGYQQVAVGVRPGSPLPVNSTASFGIEHFQGNWWIMYANQWIGFFPDSLWGGRYTRTGLTQWFGEVAAGSTSPCTDMGNGLFASSPFAAAMFGLGLFNGPAVGPSISATNSFLYAAQSTSAASFRYGGPGAC